MASISPRLAERTCEYYYAHTHRLSRWADGAGVSVGAFTPAEFWAYLNKRKEEDGVKEQTLRHERVVAGVFFRFCDDRGFVAQNPLAGLEYIEVPEKYIQCPKDTDVAALRRAVLERADKAKNPNVRHMSDAELEFLRKRDLALVSVLVGTAARIGEAIGLEITDVPNCKSVVFKRTKGKRPRTIPLTVSAREDLEEYLAVRPDVGGETRLFVTVYGDPLKVRCAQSRMRSYCRYAGIRNINPHLLRHYSLTEFCQVSIYLANRVAGHKSLATTAHYTHDDPEAIREGVELADPVGRLKGIEHARKRHKPTAGPAAGRKKVVGM